MLAGFDDERIEAWEQESLEGLRWEVGRAHTGELEDAFLYGAFPATQAVVIFRDRSLSPGCRFGYAPYVFEDPADGPPVLLAQFGELLSSLRGGRFIQSLRRFGWNRDEVLWIDRPPGMGYGGPDLDLYDRR